MRPHSPQIIATIVVLALMQSTAIEAKSKILAAPKCWAPPEITAAKVNELSILLNVQALRCRNEDTTIQDQYDGFTRASQSTMKSVSTTVKGHFGRSDKLYDNYAISLANKYGAGVKGQSCTAVAGLIQSAIASGKSFDGLSQVAETANINPTLAGGACPLHPLKPFVVKSAKAKSRRHK